MDTLVSLAGRFPLPGLVRDLHPLDDTHAGQTKVGAAACRDPNFVNFTSTVMKNIDEAQSHHLFYEYLLAIDNQDAFRASWHTYAGNVIDGVGSAAVVVVGFDTVDACCLTSAAADVTFAI